MTSLALSRRQSLAFSDFGSEDDEHVDTNGGDYTTRMDELFADEDGSTPTSVLRFDGDEDDEDEEPFVYDGEDAPVSRATYREQLRDVLDDDDDKDDDDDDDEVEEREVERSLVRDFDRPPITIGDEGLVSPSIRHACSMLISRGRTPASLPPPPASCTWRYPRNLL